MLGVTINDRLSADELVADTIAACSKSLYVLHALRTHGMPTAALHNVFRATVLIKLLYCNQAYSSFCSAAALELTHSSAAASAVATSHQSKNCLPTWTRHCLSEC
jgi:hypothetical protein